LRVYYVPDTVLSVVQASSDPILIEYLLLLCVGNLGSEMGGVVS
jgi:hypothetical protein